MKVDKPQQRWLDSFQGCFAFFGEARTRILLWYVVLMVFFITLAFPVVRQRLFSQVQERVKNELLEEMKEFNNIIGKGFKSFDEEDKEELRRRNKKINWEPPKNLQDLKEVFDIHLSDELPDDDVFYIAILDGEFYKSTPRGLPAEIDRDSRIMQGWKQLRKPSQREVDFSHVEDVESVLYVAEPVVIDDQVMGVLVIAHTTAGEREEADQAIQIVVEVMIFGLLLALILVWLVAGKILAPLQVLAKTTQEINEADLTKRIPVNGSGEIAKLTTTFNGMMDRLEVAFATQRDFVNDAGHELRTPIAIIRGHLELMGDDPQEQQETLVIVMDELDRMTRFVDDLILLAKSERPDFLLLEKVNIAAFTEELFTKAKALAPRNWQLDAVAVGEIVVDRQRLTQAVMNLAQNATQHTKEGGSITIGSGVSSSKVRFWVQDEGEGIAPADQKRIFERFARASKSRRRSEGAGLGLAIVRAIAQAHGGKIYLRSNLGTGSNFTIVLPVIPLKQEAASE